MPDTNARLIKQSSINPTRAKPSNNPIQAKAQASQAQTTPAGQPTDKPAQPAPASPIVQLIGQRIVIQERGSGVVKGTVSSYKGGLIKLSDAEVVGINHSFKVPWVMVDRTTVVHLHPDPEQEDEVGKAAGI